MEKPPHQETVNIQLSPNPVKNFVTVSTFNNTQMSYTIYNLTGQQMAQGSFSTSSKIDVSVFPAGVYVLELSGEKDVFREKFVKR